MATSYYYDPKTGTWKPQTSSGSSSSTGGSPANTGSSVGGSSGGKVTSPPSSPSTSTGSTSPQHAVDTEVQNVEYDMLNGELVLHVTQETIKIKIMDTIEIQGVGRFLSGFYYVAAIKRSISSSAYAHTLTVVKTEFGKSMKK